MRKLIRMGTIKQLHKRIDLSSSDFCGKNLRNDCVVPRKPTRRTMEYTVENIAAFPNSVGLISQVVMGVIKKDMKALNHVPREKAIYFLKRACSLRVIRNLLIIILYR
jgi:hypothetical protein